MNKTNQPVTYLINFTTTFVNVGNQNDGFINIQQSAVFANEAAEITPTISHSDANFTTIKSYTNDFGSGLLNATGTIQHEKIITLNPGERTFFRYIMESAMSLSQDHQMGFSNGGFKVTRLT